MLGCARMIIGFCRSGAWPPRWRAAGPARSSGCCSPTRLRPGRGAGRRGRRRGARLERASSPSAADLVVLAVKPAKLEEVAAELGGGAKTVVSLLGATPLETVAAAFPERRRLRVMPNVGGRGAAGRALRGRRASRRRCAAMLELLGHVVELPDDAVRRRDRGDGLRARLPGAGGRGARRRRRRRRPRRGAGPRAGGRDDRRDRRAAARSATRPTCAGRSPRPAAAPRPGSRRSTAKAPARPSRRRCGPRWRGCGADDPAGARPAATSPTTSARSSSSTSILILLNILISWVPRMPYNRAGCARCSTSSPRPPTPTSTSSGASCRRSAAAASRSTSARCRR